MLAIGEWSLMTAFEAGTRDVAMKIFYSKIQYAGIMSAPVLWFLVVMEYVRTSRKIIRRYLTFLWIFPAITVFMALTNDWHHLIWPRIEVGPIVSGLISAGPLLIYHHGAWYWCNISFIYGLMAAAAIKLLRVALHARDLYRYQIMVLLIGAAMPWIGSFIYITGFSPIPDFDPTPIGFIFMGLCCSWAIFRYRLLELVPIACDVLIKNMVDGVIVLDASSRIVELNPAACVLLGRDSRSVIGESVVRVISQWRGTDLGLPINEDKETRGEIRVVGNKTLVFDVHCSPFYDETRSFIGRLLIFHDITDRKQVEKEILDLNLKLEERVRQRTEMLDREIADHTRAREALLKSEEKYRALVENINDVIFILDTRGCFSYISPSIEQVSGYTPEEIIGKQFTFFVHPDEIPFLMSELSKTLSGQHTPHEFRTFDKFGNIHFVRTSGRLIIEGGAVTGISGIMIDITEQKRAEEDRRRLEVQLLQAQKLESLGVLAGGIAHDSNNILTGILGNAELALLHLEPASPLQENLTDIQKASFAAAELCRQMLAYSGKGRFEIKPINLIEALKDITHLIEASI